MSGKREEGSLGEDRAVKILRREGYRVLERNYRSPFGEIDIIAEEGGFLVFIEVKKRNTANFGDPLEAIVEGKRRHIINSALFYMKKNRKTGGRVRFDVLGIGPDKAKLVKNAFCAE